MWLYQRYKYRLSKNNSLHFTQFTIPLPILKHIIESFNITHSYFSSPIVCPTIIYNYYSPFHRDKLFRLLGMAFQYKWQGLGYAHLHTKTEAHQAIHWARLVVQNNIKHHHSTRPTRYQMVQ
jgi:hypothetical protein